MGTQRVGLQRIFGVMSDDAEREACLANMRAQMVMGYQGVDQAETGGPAAASAFLQPLPAPLTWHEKWVVEMGPVLKTYFIDNDLDCPLFGYLPKVATTCKGSIGAFLSASFCERINSSANQIDTTRNTNLVDDFVDKTTVLRMNQKNHEVHTPQIPQHCHAKISNLWHCHHCR